MSAAIEPRMIQPYDRDGNKLALELAECGEVRPFTLGYQQCFLPEGHSDESHQSQDGTRWTALSCDPQPGDLIEGIVASNRPRLVRVRIARRPWPINHHSHTVTDGGQTIVALLSSSIQIVESA